MSNEGFADETTGSTEFEGHYALFVLPADHIHTVDEDRADARKVTIPAGAYILFTAETGAVELIRYHSQREAREDFARADAAYEAWMGDD